MKKRVIVPGERSVERGSRRLRLVDHGAMLMSVAVLLVTVGLAVFSALTGFHESWYGDILTLLDWIVGLLALINVLCTFSAGIRIYDGNVDLGSDGKGGRRSFDVSFLHAIAVVDGTGNVLDPQARRWRNAGLKFQLRNGTAVCTRPSVVFTARQYRAVCRFFDVQN